MRQALVEGLGRIGADLAHAVLATAVFAGCLALAIWAGKRSRRQWVGWLVFISAFGLSTVALGPSLRALEVARCSGLSDYDGCMESRNSWEDGGR